MFESIFEKKIVVLAGLVIAMMAAPSLKAQTYQATPINDLGTGLYLNQFEGGLYENGTNTVPTDHATDGSAIAAAIAPVNGKFVLMSIGMSNTNLEWSAFITAARNDSTVNHTTMAVANGAQGGADACVWTFATAPPTPCNNSKWTTNLYDYVRDNVLKPQGLTESQVEVIWLKQADHQPTVSLPNSNADAYTLEKYEGEILRAAKSRYPNLRLAFLSSRIYAGYATSTLNPEPYAYESGFTAKWTIQAQVNQHRSGQINPVAGDLGYNTSGTGVSPWIAWATYLWASGTTPRSDGLVWCNGQPGAPCNGDIDFQTDGTHPSTEGQHDVVQLLMPFFKNSPFTSRWFLAH